MARSEPWYVRLAFWQPRRRDPFDGATEFSLRLKESLVMCRVEHKMLAARLLESVGWREIDPSVFFSSTALPGLVQYWAVHSIASEIAEQLCRSLNLQLSTFRFGVAPADAMPLWKKEPDGNQFFKSMTLAIDRAIAEDNPQALESFLVEKGVVPPLELAAMDQLLVRDWRTNLEPFQAARRARDESRKREAEVGAQTIASGLPVPVAPPPSPPREDEPAVRHPVPPLAELELSPREAGSLDAPALPSDEGRAVRSGVGRPHNWNHVARPLRILHISDLHERAAFEGMPAERGNRLQLDAEERGYVLGTAFSTALRDIAKGGIDLVCFTGDLADWGHPNEYVAATKRINAILGAVEVPKNRFFAVPGNHDVQRSLHGKDGQAWQGLRDWYTETRDGSRLGRWFREIDGAPRGVKSEWRAQILERSEAFWAWLDSFTGAGLRPRAPKLLGYRHLLPAGSFKDVAHPVHIVGLDSAWLSGGNNDQGQILVTGEQVLAHVRNGSELLDGFRIALVHHPLHYLGDHDEVRRLLADDGVDLLLHGHQHVPLAIVTDEPGARLRVLAAGCLMEGDLGKNWPNGFQLIEVDPLSKAGAAHFRSWSRAGRFWSKESALYRNAPDGTLQWRAEATAHAHAELETARTEPKLHAIHAEIDRAYRTERDALANGHRPTGMLLRSLATGAMREGAFERVTPAFRALVRLGFAGHTAHLLQYTGQAPPVASATPIESAIAVLRDAATLDFGLCVSLLKGLAMDAVVGDEPYEQLGNYPFLPSNLLLTCVEISTRASKLFGESGPDWAEIETAAVLGRVLTSLGYVYDKRGIVPPKAPEGIVWEWGGLPSDEGDGRFHRNVLELVWRIASLPQPGYDAAQKAIRFSINMPSQVGVDNPRSLETMRRYLQCAAASPSRAFHRICNFTAEQDHQEFRRLVACEEACGSRVADELRALVASQRAKRVARGGSPNG